LHKKKKQVKDKGFLMSKYPHDPLIRGSFFKINKEYAKLRKYKKKQFRQQIIDLLSSEADMRKSRQENDLNSGFCSNSFTFLLSSSILLSNLGGTVDNSEKSGLDMIGNELLKTAQTYLNPCLVKLFNAVFTSGMYPQIWLYFSIIHFNTKMWSEVLDFFGNPIWFS
jgi:hypothetical protein